MTTPADQPAEPIVPLDPDTPEGRQAAEELSDVLARAHLRIQGESRPADLVAWLRQQLDDDEQVARTVPEAPWAARTDPTSHPDVISVPRDQQRGRDEIVLSDVWRDGMAAYVTQFDPARVLAEVDAKRRILDAHADAVRMHRLMDETDDDGKWDWLFKSEALEGVLKLMALPYADRPGYREEWRP